MTYRHHSCTDRCRRQRLEEAHARAHTAHREKVAATFRGRRIRIRPVHANGGL